MIAVLMLALALGMCACRGQEERAATTETTMEIRGYFFDKNGVEIGLDMPVAALTGRLGQPLSKHSCESCAFGGMDTIYYYKGLQISANDETGDERIYDITLTDETYATREGVRVGDGAARVNDRYGPSQGVVDNLLVYHKEGMKLMFLIDDGKVSAIRYSLM